jgi:GNAT superfamily N-acetyltransferase
MPDMLVKLYALPALEPSLAAAAKHGIAIRRALASEKPQVIEWMHAHYPRQADETAAAFSHNPISCFLALRDQTMVGFACYDAAAKNFFGPTAVLESERRRGTGRALLLAALHAQHDDGYAYAIIGGVGPAEFYAKTVGASLIDGSTLGIYANKNINKNK